ncbi:hypothetical protein KCU78_g478, partial [Aureobasidium melanogenum]
MSRLSEDASRRKRVNYTISDDWTSGRGSAQKLRLYALETTVGYVPPQDSVQDKHDQQLVHLSRPQLFTERQHALSPQQRDQYQRQGMDPVVNQPGEILLTSGTSVDAKDDTHAMSLHSAIEGGHKEIVPLLLDRGADVNAKDETGSTPLHAASDKGYKEIVQLLLDYGADVNAKERTYGTPLHIALARGHKEIAQLLLDRSADVNARNRSSSTPLYGASFTGYKDIVQLLLDRGADVNAKDETYETPLHAASDNGHKEIAQLLLDRGADVNAKSEMRETPLHAASFEGHKDIVQLLLDRGADVNAGSALGRDTPLQVAKFEGHKEIVQLLLDYGADNSISSQDRVVDFSRSHSGESGSGIHGSRHGHTRDRAGCHPEDDNNVSEMDLENIEIAEHGGNTSDTNYEDDDSLAEDEPRRKRAHIEDLHDFNNSISRQHNDSLPVTSHTHKGKNIPRD